MTLIKDLIHIPERVQRSDFVLNLASGVVDAERTLAEYVVTPQLVRCFDDALGFVKSAVASGRNLSRGVYLHGSFGTGKSHFMAVLHLLLQSHPGARAIPELGSVIARHDAWLAGRNTLLVPYHMIGAASLEDGVLGGYARHIRRLHPDAPVPGFYLADRLFDDARALRRRIGDETFFAALNEHAETGDDAWGEVEGGWDGTHFDAVVSGEADQQERERLVGDLIASLFTSYADDARQRSVYCDIDQGLATLCRHARALGYDGVVLFLDELILWLASRLADSAFIGREIQKIVKLVEPGQPRDLPLVSVIARQRDLREFVGQQTTGAQQQAISDALHYWEGRFHTITLEDRNLPVIAEKRLLRPVSEEARRQLDQAFAETASMREELFTVLLTSQGDRELFRRVYPFSPALVQALVALSSALQRERTALKVMLMLLVEQRETLQLGQLIPVGDLYEVIATEAEPFSEQMRRHFDIARGLFERKLRPLLLEEHGLSRDELDADPGDDARMQALRNDERLLRTLLLAALTPEVECFQQLTATKLAALNHGSIRSPIPGREAQLVLQKCRRWAGQVGEIKITDDSLNPTIAIQLAGVDTESILEQARTVDNTGNRRRLLKELLFAEFGITESDGLFDEHELPWRGTRRRVDVLFANVRELADESLTARGDSWRFVIDFPFDEGDHSPADDQARIGDYLVRDQVSSTVCWLPYFFTPETLKLLGKLVILDHVLKSDERFNTYSSHLPPVDKTQARALLDNQRSQLRQQIRNCLASAYGIDDTAHKAIDRSAALTRQVVSLDPTFTPQLPVGATLRDAFAQLIAQALAHQFPDHPEFETEPRPADLGKILEELRRAIHAENGRIEVDRPLRPLLRQLAQPLELGTMYENHFVFADDWPQRFQRELNRAPGEISVRRLRELTDRPRARGLPTAVQNLLILVFAEYWHFRFVLHGTPYDATLRNIADEAILRQQLLPTADQWQRARQTAAELLSIDSSPLLNTTHLGAFDQSLDEAVSRLLPDCRALLETLEERCAALEPGSSTERLATARLAVELLEQLQGQDALERTATLAAVRPATSTAALARSIERAGSLGAALTETNWALLEGLWNNPEQPRGRSLRDEVVQALRADELTTSLALVLARAEREATAVLTRARPVDSPSERRAVRRPAAGQRVVTQETRDGLDSAALHAVVEEIEAALRAGSRRRVRLHWEIVEPGDDV